MNSSLSAEASQAATQLVAAVKELLDAVAVSKEPIPVDELEFLCSRVQSARIGFPFIIEECIPQQINRLGSVLLGPVFTSQVHPWPSDDDGRPMAPLCQLNAADFPQAIEGIDGLVQVWMSQSDGGAGSTFIRVVPPADAEAALMTPVIQYPDPMEVLLPESADWLRDYHSDTKPSKYHYITAAALKLGHANADELADADWDEWARLSDEYQDKYGDDVVPCMQITGFEEGRVYCDITEDQKIAMTSLGKLLTKLQKKSVTHDAELVRLLANTCSAYQAWVEHVCDQTYPCLLGTFSEIQYRAADKDAPFICFESIGMREWGGGGNAQVFYSKDNGFSFDWSCT